MSVPTQPGAARAEEDDDRPTAPSAPATDRGPQDAGVEPGEDAAGQLDERGESDGMLFERIRVVGSPEQASTIPGSVSYIGKEQLARHDYTDVHRIVALAPGVIFQEEDGYGLRPNIGMRGTGVERSQKITLLEDGVLIAPAPYAAPSAYYFPTAARMEGVEVRKGSGSIQQGPLTNGGVLNFMSSSIPDEPGGRLSLAAGSHGILRGRAKVGGSGERFGWLVETFQIDTRGFKDLDGGGNTGFDLQDYLVKLRFTSSSGAPIFQALELKLGKTEQLGNETYLGLTQRDFDRTPFRRYAGSREDRIDTDHEQVQLRYLVRPSNTLDLTATLYNNDFFRNWHKLEQVNGVSIANVLGDPVTYAPELAILRAELARDSAADALAVRNNRRDYYSRGVDAVLGIRPGGGRFAHEIELGVRYHEDQEDRFQEEDLFRMTVAGEMELTALGEPGSQSNRVSGAEALSLFFQDTIALGQRWTVTPGVRFETIDYRRVDYEDAERSVVGGTRENKVDAVIPGVGLSYRLDDGSTVFGGVHRGFSPPGPSAVDTDVEDSVNYELGYRRSRGALRAELVGFFNDYDNLLGACTAASGCSTAEVGDVFHGGEVEVHGLEVALSYDWGQARDGRFQLPLNLSYTFTRAEFRNSFSSDFDPWGDVQAGDELPYLPQHQASLGAGVVHERWSAFTNLIFVDRTRTVAGQGPIPERQSTDSRLLVDLSVSYELRPDLRLNVQLRNLTDEIYVAARRPAGLRPGIGRTALLGVGFDF